MKFKIILVGLLCFSPMLSATTVSVIGQRGIKTIDASAVVPELGISFNQYKALIDFCADSRASQLLTVFGTDLSQLELYDIHPFLTTSFVIHDCLTAKSSVQFVRASDGKIHSSVPDSIIDTFNKFQLGWIRALQRACLIPLGDRGKIDWSDALSEISKNLPIERIRAAAAFATIGQSPKATERRYNEMVQNILSLDFKTRSAAYFLINSDEICVTVLRDVAAVFKDDPFVIRQFSYQRVQDGLVRCVVLSEKGIETNGFWQIRKGPNANAGTAGLCIKHISGLEESIPFAWVPNAPECGPNQRLLKNIFDSIGMNDGRHYWAIPNDQDPLDVLVSQFMLAKSLIENAEQLQDEPISAVGGGAEAAAVASSTAELGTEIATDSSDEVVDLDTYKITEIKKRRKKNTRKALDTVWQESDISEGSDRERLQFLEDKIKRTIAEELAEKQRLLAEKVAKEQEAIRQRVIAESATSAEHKPQSKAVRTQAVRAEKEPAAAAAAAASASSHEEEQRQRRIAFIQRQTESDFQRRCVRYRDLTKAIGQVVQELTPSGLAQLTTNSVGSHRVIHGPRGAESQPITIPEPHGRKHGELSGKSARSIVNRFVEMAKSIL